MKVLVLNGACQICPSFCWFLFESGCAPGPWKLLLLLLFLFTPLQRLPQRFVRFYFLRRLHGLFRLLSFGTPLWCVRASASNCSLFLVFHNSHQRLSSHLFGTFAHQHANMTEVLKLLAMFPVFSILLFRIVLYFDQDICCVVDTIASRWHPEFALEHFNI